MMDYKNLNAIINSVEKYQPIIAQLQKQMEYYRQPIIEYQNSFLRLQNQLKTLCEPMITAKYQMQNLIKQTILPDYINQNKALFANIQKITNSYVYLNAKAIDSIIPKINTYAIPTIANLQNIAGSIDFSKLAEQLQLTYEILEKKRINSMLLDQYWLIMDANLFEEIKRLPDSADLNKFIINYYTENKNHNIIELLSDVINYGCCSHREDIIKSCIQIIKHSPQKHVYNMVIPVLSAQMTGIFEDDCYRLIEETRKNEIKNSFNKGETASQLSIVTRYLESEIDFKTFNNFYKIIKEKAFCNGKKLSNLSKEEKEKYNKFRPKILHGDKNYLDYGTKENFVRSCLEFAFSAKILFLVCDKSLNQEFEEEYAK